MIQETTKAANERRYQAILWFAGLTEWRQRCLIAYRLGQVAHKASDLTGREIEYIYLLEKSKEQ